MRYLRLLALSVSSRYIAIQCIFPSRFNYRDSSADEQRPVMTSRRLLSATVIVFQVIVVYKYSTPEWRDRTTMGVGHSYRTKGAKCSVFSRQNIEKSAKIFYL